MLEQLLERIEAGRKIDERVGREGMYVAQEETHVLGERGSENPRLS